MNGRSFSARACERARELVSVQLDGVLPEHQRRELDRHLARCEACSAAATEMALVVARVRSEPLLAADLPIARPAPRRVRHGRRAVRMAAAGSALAAATVLGFVVASPRRPPH